MSVWRRLARWVQLTYPPSFRESYGDELDALLTDVDPGPREVGDLLRHGVLAWLRPAVVGHGPERARRRMQASVSTTWVAWAAGFLVAPAVNRAVLDPPLPGADSAVRALLGVAVWAFAVGWVVALLAGVPLGLRVVGIAWRRRDRTTLMLLAPSVVLLGLEASATVVLALLAPGRIQPVRPIPAWLVGLGALWLLGLACLIVSGAVGPALALGRAGCSARALKMPTVLAAPLALALAVATGASLAATVRADGGPLTAVPVAVAGVAAAVALTSAGRGLRVVLRH